MTDIIFNGVTLNPSLQWIDRYEFSTVAQSDTRTLGGVPVIFAQPIQKGQLITLEASESIGWFTTTMVDALKGFANSTGASYLLQFHGEDHIVMFDHSNPPAVSFQGLVPRQVYQPDDPFSGVIRLITI